MVAGAITGNISAEATTPTGNTFVEAMRGIFPSGSPCLAARRDDRYTTQGTRLCPALST